MRAVADLLKSQPKDSDGTYRALASRWVEGQGRRTVQLQGNQE